MEPAVVLVCDDTASIRQLIRLNLELEGFTVEEAADGHSAMARLIDVERPVPDAVTIDAQMAPKDGWWAIAAIRAHPRLDDMPVVMITASVQEHERRAAAAAGFDAFIGKPFEIDDLVDVISRLVKDGRTPGAPL